MDLSLLVTYLARGEGSERLTKAREGSKRLGIYGFVKTEIDKHTDTHKQYKMKTENNPAASFAEGRAWLP